jgi:hypothetical protein
MRFGTNSSFSYSLISELIKMISPFNKIKHKSEWEVINISAYSLKLYMNVFMNFIRVF